MGGADDEIRSFIEARRNYASKPKKRPAGLTFAGRSLRDVAERELVRTWVQNSPKFSDVKEYIVITDSEPPDCRVNFQYRGSQSHSSVTVEVTELVRIEQQENSEANNLNPEFFWDSSSAASALQGLIDKKLQNYSKKNLKFDFLLICTDEEGLTTHLLNEVLLNHQFQYREVFQEVHLMKSYDPVHQCWPTWLLRQTEQGRH
ncbi:hypothetical protein [Aquidulcibacter sp.]|uniref:hypothetical protein n=1 Tax=Aquidulcibacter sp. TaxID=2052990 RepID=UPI0025BB2B54|nr:hypothetical protein [Aquidulcibacter sp.]MCA3695741.1 hypothetical protein [Aquidulcibacter sp.]